MEKKSGRKLWVLCTDNGREFTVGEFTSYCVEEGIECHYSAPYSPQQNGVVEGRNQTVVAMARALLKQRRLPAWFWGEAVVTAVHLLNQMPTKALSGMTPYKALVVAHLRTFGCLAFTKDLTQLKKPDDRSHPGVYIGYADGLRLITSSTLQLSVCGSRAMSSSTRAVGGTGTRKEGVQLRWTRISSSSTLLRPRRAP
jgi:hypothetical protein